MKPASKLLIEEPEFGEARRGYDRNQVNSFLERIDDAVAELQRQLAQANERARAAEAELAARPGGEGTEQISRTLVLAQRTADAALAEARAEAEQHLEKAREEAEQHVGRARAEGDRMALEAEAYSRNQRAEGDRYLNDAKTEAARIAEEAETAVRMQRDNAQADLRNELRELEGSRELFRDDIAILERHLEVQRTRLRIGVEEIQRLLDDPASLRTEPAPELAAEPLPTLDPEGSGEPDGDDATDGPDGADAEAESSSDETNAAVSDEADAEAEAEQEPEPAAATSEVDGGDTVFIDEQSPFGGPADGDDADVTLQGPAPAPVEQPEPAAAEPAAALAEVAEVAEEDSEDAFLVELRKAMTDEEPLGPRDLDMNRSAGHGGQAEENRRPRFGRRR